MRSTLPLVSVLVGLAAGIGLTLPSVRSARGDTATATLPVSEIHEGMKGYGLSVFHGTEPERFDVEVIGVLRNFRPGQDLILIKTPNNARLDVAKVVHGMSGSPIFLNGKLAGAYSYSLSEFPSEPIAGVTPIAAMLAVLHRPTPPGFWPTEGGEPLPMGTPPGTPVQAASSLGVTGYEGEPGTYDLSAHAAQIAKRMQVDRSRTWIPNATPLLLSGVGDRTAAFLRELVQPLGLETLQAGGGGGAQAADAPMHFVDGGTLGVPLVTGDMSMMALGTATHVEGRRLCGFGHPFFEAGDSALPAAIARILWIHASLQSSVKIGELVRPVGALVQDRQAAVVVDETKTAPTFPVTFEIKGVVGAAKTTWNARVAEEQFLTPSLTASVLGAAVEATTSERRDITWQLQSKVSIRNHGTITLDDFGVAIGGMPDSGDFGRARVVRALGDTISNPWERARIDKIESVLTVHYARDLWRLRGVDALEDTVDAGDSAHLVIHLVPFLGKEVTKTIDVKLPAELAGKEVEIELLPGYEVAPDLAAPENLTELLANETRQSVTPKSIVAQLKIPRIGVAYNGHVAPGLPPFALDTLRPAHSDDGPEPFTTYARTVVPVDQYIEGHDKVKVKVRAVVR